MADVIPAGSRLPSESLGGRLETPARDAEREAQEREEQERQREEAQARENAVMNDRLRRAAGRVPAEEQAPEDEAGLPEDELRERQFQRAVEECSVLPEAVEDVRTLLDWDAVDADNDQTRAVDKAVRALVARKPYLAHVEGADGGARTPSSRPETTNQHMDRLIRRAAGRDVDFRAVR